MYGKLEDGKLITAPINYVNSEDKLIFNFNEKPEIMKEYGFKEVIDVIPKHDNKTQDVTFKGYVDTGNTIEVQYVITKKPVVPLSPEEELTLLRAQIETMQEAIDFMLFVKEDKKI